MVQPDTLDAVQLGLRIAHHLLNHHRSAWQSKQLLLLLGSQVAFDALIAGASVSEVAAGWQQGLTAFEQRRRPFLRY